MNLQLIIMCKAPVSGQVKTRLTSRYSAAEAMRLHAAMAATVVRRASRLFKHVWIAADDPAHPFFDNFDVRSRPQGDGDLGERMNRLMLQAFAEGADAVLFLGTDSPHMPDARLMEAANALQQVDVVIGPVEDGGYDLIAMRSPWSLFSGIQWSSCLVMQQTMAQIEQLGLTSLQLDTAFDVDFPADIDRAIQAGWIVE